MAITLLGNERLGVGSAISLATIWIVCMGASVVVAGADVEQAALPAIPATLGAGLALKGGGGWRLLTVIALVPAALIGPDILAWTVAGVSTALFAGTAATRPAPLFSDPQRHLISCRRREQSATILVVDVPGLDSSRLRGLQKATRVSDSLDATRIPGGRRIYGVLDGDDVDRAAVERRLTAVLGDDAVFGWASFPQDGYTLELLIEHARSRVPPGSQRLPSAGAHQQVVFTEVALRSAEHANREGATR